MVAGLPVYDFDACSPGKTMSKEKLLKARNLIDEGKYSQARRILKNIDDPKADRLMAEINNLAPLAPSGTGARDIIQVILLGLVFTALFTGIGYVIASGIGIPKSAANPVVVNTPSVNPIGATRVAVQPTVPPTATEVPCEAQAWWDANRAPFESAVNIVLTANIQTPGSTINNAKNAFTAWRTTFEGEETAPCVAAAKQAILNAAPQIQAVFELVSEPDHRATTGTGVCGGDGYSVEQRQSNQHSQPGYLAG